MDGEIWTFLISCLLMFGICNGQIYKFSQNESLSFEGQKLENHVFSEFTTKNLVTQCAMECFHRKRCASFNFAKESHTCQLNDATHADYPGDFKDYRTEYDYHLRDAFYVNPEAVGPCGSFPCQNDGRCLDTYRDDSGNRNYLCLCQDGWSGKNCDVKKHVLDWSDWADWGACSATCGNGYQVRHRKCMDTVTDTERPVTDCYGSDIDYQACPYKDCPRWDEWGSWGDCSTKYTCGIGTMKRTRNCTNGGVVGVDRYCLGPISESAVCRSIKCLGMVRLRNGTEFGEGRVEFYHDTRKQWLQVCGDDWDLSSSEILCKQRGFLGAHAAITDDSYPSNIIQSGVILKCNGTEKTLQQCVREEVDTCNGTAGTQCRVKGIWSLWSEWGECSVTCEDGIRTRRRECNHPPPNHGGKPCPGKDVDYKNCTMIMCPVDGFWAPWTPWSDCSVTCENGTQFRTRQCNSPLHGGADCPGDQREVRGCFPKMCPVDGYWHAWESWSDCSATCGYGNRNRSRICQQPLYEGAPCVGDESQTEGCNMFSCPVDGSWKPWESWGECSTTCGGGHRNRSRDCNTALHGGMDCIGDSMQTEDCNMHNCPVDGVWIPWSDWTDCSVSCALGRQSRNRTCEGPFYGGSNCTGDEYQEQDCMLVECPVDGVWQPWSEWEECNVTCGGGSHSRYRTCIQPQFGGAPCNGSDIDTRECNTHFCPVNGTWYAWTNWTECSTTCGGGSQTRNRTCEEPMYGGFDCEGPVDEIRNCSMNECPVDGYWYPWSKWTICSHTCGGGSQRRTRLCVEPQYGGKYCKGDSIEIQDCNTGDCPVDGSWRPWTEWSMCTLTCGNGTQTRNRSCDDPLFGGSNCTGDDTQLRYCNDHHCPIDGIWINWSEWDDCSVSCGNGTRYRNRTCIEPKYGGTSCDGPDLQSEYCNLVECPVDGVWMAWSNWTTCDVTCGGGVRHRNRTCDGPYYNGLDCNGTDWETETCSEHNCPVDGIWTLWAEWTDCEVTCGGGSRYRNRTCNGPYYGGAECNGTYSEIEDCKTQNCPVDGKLTDWTIWTICQVSCGGGKQKRERICVGPFWGGDNCTGHLTEVRTCHDNPCPVDGQWSLWSNWDECTLSCGGGSSRRYRFCTQSAHGGDDCSGDSEEFKSCNNHSCPVDGVFEEWSMWSECTVRCGGGEMYRNRSCDGPYYGGQPCAGEWNETATCNDHPCPVNGYWDNWNSWETCNVSCGGGIQQRTRECIMPLHGGEGCNGTNVDYRECNTNPCPIDGAWQEWGNWTTCDLTCGGGMQSRYRDCQEPQYGGAPCMGNDTQHRSCNDLECPIDGVWDPWALWSVCSLTCGNGTQWRNRTCEGPFFNGQPCNGSDFEERLCNTFNCPIDGVFSEWSDWYHCNVTCGGGEQWRNRSCNGPYYGGAPCGGPYDESRSCNEHNCPIDGIWLDWSEWDPCNVTCGGGIQWRNRTCEGPFYGGSNCYGSKDYSRNCNDNPCPIDGYWEDWSGWEHCNVTCGGGIRQRNRTCVMPLYGGANCTGDHMDYEECNTLECPVDGNYEPWGAWGQCNVSCGGGKKIRTRICIEPEHGGAECQGPPMEDADCNTQNCPIDGVWKIWSPWSDCDVSCGGGMSYRNRSCNGPYYGGSECTGEPNEDKVCNTNPCPINGDWFDWGAWSRCSVSCNGGVRSRSRECDMNSYGNLTAPCAGDSVTTEACHTFSCKPYESHCTGWKDKGLVDSGYVQVAPTTSVGYQLDEVTVYCDMEANGGKGTTIIGHDKEERTRVSGFEGSGDYALILNYNVSVSHAIAIIDASENCSQFLEWQCKGAVIHNPNQDGHWTTYWSSRASAYLPIGQKKPPEDYFPGAVPGSGMCACGSNRTANNTNTCDEPGYTCNCDINDAQWRADGGYVTEKTKLPIVAFYAGDTGNEGVEEGAVTVGRVKCYGNAPAVDWSSFFGR